jgi:hypothetical protein
LSPIAFAVGAPLDLGVAGFSQVAIVAYTDSRRAGEKLDVWFFAVETYWRCAVKRQFVGARRSAIGDNAITVTFRRPNDGGSLYAPESAAVFANIVESVDLVVSSVNCNSPCRRDGDKNDCWIEDARASPNKLEARPSGRAN